ncbi:bacterial Ig-like domain-containing protein [Lapidilactobacillus mulanensis]|uniref:Bacterial Ig-like domain-containing protein n=1 Tax=Lapidilactobacillus mulanensis TaxID=2485999 RepID=A0ABW4DMP4_9LACO|nr:bacterial Ig-like domain-containing protein [Lapidilactobacillus mulanensis]
MRNFGERKVHFKMYKAGKFWVVAGIAIISLGIIAPAVPAFAATDQSAISQVNSSSAETATSSKDATEAEQASLDKDTSASTSNAAITVSKSDSSTDQVKNSSSDTSAVQKTTTVSLKQQAKAMAPATTAETDYSYTTNTDGTLTITGYTGAETALTIPSTIDGKTVTAIGAQALWFKNLTSVVIPDSVITIGDQAFNGNELTNVQLSANLQTIGSAAFIRNPLTSIVIPDTVTTIGSFAFEDNKLAGTLNIPAQVTTIGESAFAGNKIESITLPTGLQTISDSAFANNLISSLTLPNSLQTIGDSAFINNYISSLTLPDGLQSIGSNAFYNNGLANQPGEHFVIPASVTSIGDQAFAYNQLVGVDVLGDLTTAGTGIFYMNGLQYLSSVNALYGNDQNGMIGTAPVNSLPNGTPVPVNGKIPVDGYIPYIYVNGKLLTAEIENYTPGVIVAGNYLQLPMNADGSTINQFMFMVTYSDAAGNFMFGRVVMSGVLNILAHNSTIYTSDDWSAADNFDSGVNNTFTQEGVLQTSQLSIGDLSISGTVDTKTPGDYDVIYSYGPESARQSTTITVTVKADQTAVTTKNSDLYVGDKWTAEDNFASATDKDGHSIDLADVMVEGSVDTTKAGTYTVTYSYGGKTSTATVIVKADQTAVTAKNSDLYVGDKWTAEDNFVGATDKDGHSIDFADVTVKGSVDTTKAGTYTITYSYGGKTATATITVSPRMNSVQLVGHDLTQQVGSKHPTAQAFVTKAIDGLGADVTAQVTADFSQVDWSHSGDYVVTLTVAGQTSRVYLHLTAVPTIPEPAKPSVPNHNNQNNSHDQQTTLPQTNEAKSMGMVIIGLLSLIGSAFGFEFTMRKKTNRD